MENEIKTVYVSLTEDEVRLITECLLNCPLEASVKAMPHIVGMVQGIVGKMAPPSPSPAPPPPSTAEEGIALPFPPRWGEES
jgi:hypothetical protein